MALMQFDFTNFNKSRIVTFFPVFFSLTLLFDLIGCTIYCKITGTLSMNKKAQND